MLVPVFLSSIFQSLTRLWAYIRTQISRHHTLFFSLCAFVALRIAFGVNSILYTSLYRLAVNLSQAIRSGNSYAGGLSFLSTFSLVNTIFPVYETFLFLSTLLTVKGMLLVYSFIRNLYKNIPLKAT